jgi:peptide/nickel transport system substrate-binding protein
MVTGILFINRISYGGPSELRVAIKGDMLKLDPPTLSTTTDRFLCLNILNGLVTFKPGTCEIEKDLAESYNVSSDGKIITFKLRKGVKFHKGYGELTSSDVKFTLMRHLDPKVKSRDFLNYSIVDHIEIPDKYTVKVSLKTPSAGFLGILAFHGGFILSEKAVNELGDKVFTENPIGTGPFQFESRIAGSETVLIANEDYFLGSPKIKKLIFKVIPDASVSINAVQRGDIDFYGVEDIGAFRSMLNIKDKNFKISSSKKGSITMYLHYINCRRSPCKDLKVRQAMAYAIDAKAIARSFGALFSYSPSVFPIVFETYTNELPTYKYDIEQAKKLLKEAGYNKTTKLRITYVDYGLDEPVAVMVKDYLSKIMDTEIDKWDISAFREKLKEGNWDVYCQQLSLPTEDLFCNKFYHSKAGGNFTGYENAELDQLIEKADMEQDAAKRKAMYVKVQKIMASNLPYIAAGVLNNVEIMNKNLEGVIGEGYPAVAKFHGAFFKK